MLIPIFFIIKPTRCTNFTNLFWHETLHVSCQNKFVKLVHLVGFIIKKFVTMQHGHMNVNVYTKLLHKLQILCNSKQKAKQP